MDNSATYSEVMENNIRLIIDYQRILIRQLDAAYKDKKLDEVTYRKFKNMNCTAQTREEIYDHYDQLFKELALYYRDRLLERIQKGAELLDSMSKDHPKYPQYMALYDTLCKELQRSEEGSG